MAKQYKGSLTLDWFNKQKSIINLDDNSIKSEKDIPAPKINWINKEEALFYEINDEEGKGNTPFWVNREDIRVKEARPLIFQKAFKAFKKNDAYFVKEIESEEDSIDIENILIKGDNLLSLNTLKRLFDKKPDSEKVKCVFIDPPFNTGQAFEHYDDNLEHSEWLTLMRDRLKALKNVLSNDGFMIVHLDDVEVHYCKILLDELLGRDSFISHITYERSGVAGLGQGGFLVNTTEHLLFYRNMTDPTGNNYGKNPLDENTIRRYNRYLDDVGEKELIKEFNSKSNKQPVKIYKHSDYIIKSISLSDFKNRESEIRKLFAKNLNKLFRGNRVQKENEFQNSLISDMDKGLYSVEYTPSRGKFQDEKISLYYYNNELLSWLGDNSEIEGDDIVKSMKLTTLWDKEDIPKADIANEGGIHFPRGKKPENLIKRVLDLCTIEGDLVLDCFGGSGSTFAVAHKMNRKWIGVEIGNHADSHIIPRLFSVMSGQDKLGISKKVNWFGGGSFKYYHLGESIINVDKETGKGEFNWNLGKAFIQESLLVSYDFIVQNDINVFPAQIFKDDNNPTIGKIIGKSGKSIYGIAFLVAPGEIAITISNEEIKTIYNVIRQQEDFQSLMIYTNKGIDIAQDAIPENLDIIKVPHAIFAELER